MGEEKLRLLGDLVIAELRKAIPDQQEGRVSRQVAKIIGG
jgi:hypothetical protein